MEKGWKKVERKRWKGKRGKNFYDALLLFFHPSTIKVMLNTKKKSRHHEAFHTRGFHQSKTHLKRFVSAATKGFCFWTVHITAETDKFFPQKRTRACYCISLAHLKKLHFHSVLRPDLITDCPSGPIGLEDESIS
jgi:hypothetical protein